MITETPPLAPDIKKDEPPTDEQLEIEIRLKCEYIRLLFSPPVV